MAWLGIEEWGEMVCGGEMRSRLWRGGFARESGVGGGWGGGCGGGVWGINDHWF